VTSTTGVGGLGFGVSSRAPLRNNDKPPFLFFFFEEVGREALFPNGHEMAFVLLKVTFSDSLIGSVARPSCLSI
jgi:hypothetical protein